jgi:hypothetical protein
VPEKFTELANIFRSSGRMFWPVTYGVLLFAVWLTLRAWGTRAAGIILAIAVVAQLFDTSAGWRTARDRKFANSGQTWVTPLRDQFWSRAGERYHTVRVIPLDKRTTGYEPITWFAASHHMSTDAAYLARVNPDTLKAASDRDTAALKAGKADPDTLYVLDESTAQLAASAKHEDDLVSQIDGRWVLAPHWNRAKH